MSMSVSTAGALNLPPAIWPPHAQGRAACRSVHVCDLFVGLVRTVYIYTVYIRYFGRDVTKYMVIYGVYIRFWTTLFVWHAVSICVCESSHLHLYKSILLSVLVHDSLCNLGDSMPRT